MNSPLSPSVPSTAPYSPNADPHKQKQTKRPRQKKGEYMKKLEEENVQLKSDINMLINKITIIESQNQTLMQQLEFFKLPGMNFPPAKEQPE
ncbi:hypothetical protein TVAG_163340 [Trichomonas vaginalis G3]|uniref:BZIP domain-containing protein n=1 Tax=Trichomonas vaginalis (strain ATCC PRA-98 / G3) TaxID=412133 RepID=A2DG11_TRIV3|nr:hypothetical protein TVAGG3_0953150 [Trichomonas vaginalis G3]EAY20638.1 hypothetical protein TVAG_163340 [Trichomonas vaginalis G3]KAI5487353.1 hypothetical protein TVAGG3_0953150 [Trichomonas vaginalis G3]|eukprot:XP_001581624.1 hypothetical protein [Trichomonas vaginalis G3]